MIKEKSVDKSPKMEYNKRKTLMTEIKLVALKLSKEYGENLKIEMDTNPSTESVKLKMTFFNL